MSLPRLVFAVVLLSSFGFGSACAADSSGNEPSAQPEGEPAGQPEGEPAGQPEGEPAGQPEGEPAGQPEGEPAGQPEGEPAGQPEGEPTPTPDSEPSPTPDSEPSPTPEAAPELLAQLEASPSGNGRQVKVAGGNIYFQNNARTALRTVPTTGGTATDVVTDDRVGEFAIDLEDGTVFYTKLVDGNDRTYALMSAPLDGSLPPTLRDQGPGSQSDLGVGSNNVYWENDGELTRVRKSDGQSTALTPTSAALDSNVVVTSGTNGGIFWGQVDRRSAPRWSIGRYANNTYTTVVQENGSDDGPESIVVDETYVYYLLANAGSVWRVPIAGGAPELLAESLGFGRVAGLRTDGTHLYYAYLGFNDMRIVRLPKQGGAVEDVVTGLGNIFVVDVDATHVYWLDGDGGLYRFPKE